MRVSERKLSADTKISEKQASGGTPGTREEIPLQPVEWNMERQAVPLQSMQIHGGADLHLQPVEHPTPEQVDAQRRL